MFPHFFIHERERDSYALAGLVDKVVTLRQEQLSRLIREF